MKDTITDEGIFECAECGQYFQWIWYYNGTKLRVLSQMVINFRMEDCWSHEETDLLPSSDLFQRAIDSVTCIIDLKIMFVKDLVISYQAPFMNMLQTSAHDESLQEGYQSSSVSLWLFLAGFSTTITYFDSLTPKITRSKGSLSITYSREQGLLSDTISSTISMVKNRKKYSSGDRSFLVIPKADFSKLKPLKEN
ncbi:hypothetical protein RF11_12374 [Thelohanellus kitauei]|uniref:Uncharacterized protein n=1 Tax=Thelohanellus kitauei TaxID=669202 RepID=A0A0C2MZW0_THEKT|nr:hypothetical protein RF11_12374 [Thelohanellus kitauei]